MSSPSAKCGGSRRVRGEFRSAGLALRTTLVCPTCRVQRQVSSACEQIPRNSTGKTVGRLPESVAASVGRASSYIRTRIAMRILIAHNTHRQCGGEDTEVETELPTSRGHAAQTFSRSNDGIGTSTRSTQGLRLVWSAAAAAEVSGCRTSSRPMWRMCTTPLPTFLLRRAGPRPACPSCRRSTTPPALPAGEISSRWRRLRRLPWPRAPVRCATRPLRELSARACRSTRQWSARHRRSTRSLADLVGDANDLACKMQWDDQHPGETAAMGRRARLHDERACSAGSNHRQLMDRYAAAARAGGR